MKSRVNFFPSSKSILLNGLFEENDACMVTYSYLFNITMISNNPKCIGSMGKFLWNISKLPHLGNLLPPTHLLLKNTSSRFFLHDIIATKYCTIGGASSPCQCSLQKSINVSEQSWNSTWYQKQQVSHIMFDLIYHGFNLSSMLTEISTLGLVS